MVGISTNAVEVEVRNADGPGVTRSVARDAPFRGSEVPTIGHGQQQLEDVVQ